MTTVRIPPLVPQIVIEQGGWHARSVDVIAIATDGRFGMALVDGNGDRANIEIEPWFYRKEGWASDGSSGGGGPWGEQGPWGVCSGIYATDATESAFVAYGYAECYEAVRIVFNDAERRISVLPSGFWLVVAADYPDGADAIILFE